MSRQCEARFKIRERNLALDPKSFVLRWDTSGIKVLFAALLVLLALSGGSAPVRPARAAGAVGLVIRHGDGRLLYAYVPLAGDRMTGAEALQKSGLVLNVSVGGSFGVAVCTIDGEGCNSPKEDCFCKSYGDPAFYWHYYLRNPDGTWRNSNLGAGNRILRDGDVDGWSWTGGESDLPTVTLDQIAAVVQPPRVTPPPAPTATPPDASSPLPTLVASVATATADTQPRAAIVAPNGSATPIQPAATPAGPSRGPVIGGFVAVVAVMLALLAIVPRGARRIRKRPR